MKRTDKAVRSAVLKATVVKKPKVFCTLTTVECILRNTSRCIVHLINQRVADTFTYAVCLLIDIPTR